MASSSKQMLDTDNNKRSASPTAVPDFEMVIGRAHSEPWESNARSHSCRIGESSRSSSSGGNDRGSGNIPEDPQRPVLPGIHTFLTGPGVSGTAYDAYLLNRYGRRSLSPPGAATHTHKSGCLLASRNAGSCECFLVVIFDMKRTLLPCPAIPEVRGPPLYRCSTPYELATDFGGVQEGHARYERDARGQEQDGRVHEYRR